MKTSFKYMHTIVARRILVLFVCCALLPVVSLAVVTIRQVTGALSKETHQRLHHASKNVGMTIVEGLDNLKADLESLSLAHQGDLRELSRRRGNVARMVYRERFLGLTLLDGASPPEIIFGGGAPYPRLISTVRRHLAEGNGVLYSQGRQNAPPRLFLAIPLNRKQSASKLLVGEVNQSYLWELTRRASLAGMETRILTRDGTLLYASAPIDGGIVQQVARGLRQSASGQFEWNGGGPSQLVNYWSVFLKPAYSSPDWVVVTSQAKADAFLPIRVFSRTFSLILFLTVLLVLLASSAQIRKSLVPLARLREGTSRISRGDFDSRVDITSGDEFEGLADSFNAMAERLGKEFWYLAETGRIVRTMLTALERDKIVAAVLGNLQTVVPCDWVALAVMDGRILDMAQTCWNRGEPGNLANPEHYLAVFSREELRKLRMATDSLFVEAGEEFQGLLSAIAGEGGKAFYLLPILSQQRLTGVLVLGYRHPPAQPREDLLRARQIADQVAVALVNATLVEELAQLNWGTLTALARAVDANSPWTAGHSERVTALALTIGRSMGLSKRRLDLLQRAGLLHDIGKIGVPAAILDKPGKLTDEEYALIKEHPEKGARILEPIAVYQEVVPIVAQHHEWFNGAGYPHGLAGDAISLEAGILAVADVFDALLADRPYRPGLPLGSVLAYVEERGGTQFNPAVVSAFLKISPAEMLRSVLDAPRSTGIRDISGDFSNTLHPAA